MNKKIAVIEVTDRDRILISVYEADISDIASFGWNKAKEVSEFEEFSGTKPLTTFRNTVEDFGDEDWIEAVLMRVSVKPDFYILFGQSRAPKKVSISGNLIDAPVFVGWRGALIVAKESTLFTRSEIATLTGTFGPVGYRSIHAPIPSRLVIYPYEAERKTPIAREVKNHYFSNEGYIQEIRKAGPFNSNQKGFFLMRLSDSHTEITYERF